MPNSTSSIDGIPVPVRHNFERNAQLHEMAKQLKTLVMLPSPEDLCLTDSLINLLP